MDQYFSSPEAGTMQELCVMALNNQKAYIETVRYLTSSKLRLEGSNFQISLGRHFRL